MFICMNTADRLPMLKSPSAAVTGLAPTNSIVSPAIPKYRPNIKITSQHFLIHKPYVQYIQNIFIHTYIHTYVYTYIDIFRSGCAYIHTYIHA